MGVKCTLNYIKPMIVICLCLEFDNFRQLRHSKNSLGAISFNVIGKMFVFYISLKLKEPLEIVSS
ncbi:hypothetical protein ES703_72377 [subsurface metagenome]